MFKLFISLTVALGITGTAYADNRSQSLAGDWKFLMDGPIVAADGAALPTLEFTDSIQLPGTTDTRKKGPENTERLEGSLTRLHKYIGPAWYQREFTVPESWSGKPVTLFLERTKHTQLWIDGKDMGSNAILCTSQEYALGKLTPGKHVITLLIDNSNRPVAGGSHQISENTQGNWNGVIGRIELLAKPLVTLENVRVTPEIAGKKINVSFEISTNDAREGAGNATFAVSGPGNVEMRKSIAVNWTSSGGKGEVELVLGDSARLWSEFDPALYTLSVTLAVGDETDEWTHRFGLREFKANGSQFTINGKNILLRGKNDCAIFPLTGHPPMDKEGWLQYLKTCQDYGLNYIRCHSSDPSEGGLRGGGRTGYVLAGAASYMGRVY